MKIAYLVHFNLSFTGGVFKKIIRQLSTWRHLGHDARLFIVTREPEAGRRIEEIVAEIPADVEIYDRPGYISARQRMTAFTRSASRIRAWSPDILYSRQDLYYRPVARLSQWTRLIIEINTFDLPEKWSESKLKFIYHFITRGKTLGSAHGLVFVTRELASSSWYSQYRRPIVVIGNGISLAAIHPPPPQPTAQPHLTFIGHPGCPWHGLDKLLHLARACPGWTFDLVGEAAGDRGACVPPNLIYHGPMTEASYAPLFGRATCAISTLAIHRNKMNEASPLKTREYLAYGLPVIIGYEDTDFPDKVDFLLRLPNAENNVEQGINQIRSFVHRWVGKRVPREAVAHLDDSVKEAERLRFFESVL